MSPDIFVNKKVWKSFTPTELEDYKRRVFDYYKKRGFPYYPTDLQYRKKELSRARKYDLDKVIEGDVIKQTMHGLAFCWSFHPHSFEVQCGNKRTPMEAYVDDEIFREVINKRLQLGDNMSDAGIRKTLKMYTNTQGVSNFRPTAAAAIYRHFNAKRVWDMSSGYGGRMLGAYLAGVEHYYGNEPCEPTYNGLMDMSHYLDSMDVKIQQKGSELGNYYIERGELDLCFTSPPYFDWEKYSDEPTQSYIKYPTKDEWIDGFITDTIKHAYYYLKSDGHLAINVANTKRFNDLEERVIQAALDWGFLQVGALKLALSSLSKTKKFKYEPVYVFKPV